MLEPSPAPKSFLQTIRALHRDVGYVIAGLTILFALSGIAQIYRDTDFLQRETQQTVTLAPGLDDAALGPALRMREVRVDRVEGSTVYFRGGSYDRATGAAVRTRKEFVFPLNRLTALHKAPSQQAVHWLTTVYGALLLFMALSSFGMYRPGTKPQRRGLVLAGIGIVAALAMLFMLPGA